ncbi:MAG: 3-hydroxyacyl-CoA dehydrogenase family protein [Actinomycetota bacterium]|nr:3-hydroxyacyl-CoA dehydrogenase family protein [Actinomycetota bacterium]
MSDLVPATVIAHGPSRSFPEEKSPLGSSVDGAEIVVHLGDPKPDAELQMGTVCTLIELGTSSLGAYTGEGLGDEGDSRIGFARWRLGDDPPSRLIELVVQSRTSASAISAATELFAAAGFEVSPCQDRTGRILDRLLRPYFNDALRALDDGVASGPDLDKTVRLGLGYPEGPLELLLRSGLHHHCEITEALYRSIGTSSFAPPRRAIVASERHQ